MPPIVIALLTLFFSLISFIYDSSYQMSMRRSSYQQFTPYNQSICRHIKAGNRCVLSLLSFSPVPFLCASNKLVILEYNPSSTNMVDEKILISKAKEVMAHAYM